jgi:hypothetical protein
MRPARPARMINSFPSAPLIVPEMAEMFGQSLVLEDRRGAARRWRRRRCGASRRMAPRIADSPVRDFAHIAYIGSSFGRRVADRLLTLAVLVARAKPGTLNAST